MGDPKRIGITGTLVAYRDGFVGELARRGYTAGSAMHQVWLMAHASRWMESQALGAGDLTPDRVEDYTGRLSGRGLAPLLGYPRGLGWTSSPHLPPKHRPGTGVPPLGASAQR